VVIALLSSAKVCPKGSDTSALAVAVPVDPSNPPAIKTVPSFSRVEVNGSRDTFMLPPGTKFPVPVTARFVVPVIPPDVAVTVVRPRATPVAKPVESIVATPGVDELQATVAPVRGWVVLFE
jgi:hypothetical protein